MLSERERRTFEEIERQIVDADPRFAASMQRLLSGRAERWACRGYDTIIVVAALSAVLCLALSSGGAGLVALVLAAVTFYLRPRRGPLPIVRRGGRRRWRSRRMST
jgi:O-antigen ligase